MTQFRPIAVAGALLMAASGAFSASEFPDGATVPDAQAVRQHVAGKSMKFAASEGFTVRMTFGDPAYILETSKGHRSEGTWRTLDGQLCGQTGGRAESCSPVRLHSGQMFMKRASNGEVVPLSAD